MALRKFIIERDIPKVGGFDAELRKLPRLVSLASSRAPRRNFAFVIILQRSDPIPEPTPDEREAGSTNLSGAVRET